MIAERSSNVCAACCTTTNNVTENFTFYPADKDEQGKHMHPSVRVLGAWQNYLDRPCLRCLVSLLLLLG